MIRDCYSEVGSDQCLCKRKRASMFKRLTAIVAAPILVASALLGTVQARVEPFMDGRTNPANLIGCLMVDFSLGGITNLGGAVRPFRTDFCENPTPAPFYFVGLPFDNAGTKRVTIMAKAEQIATLTDCQVVALSRDQTMQSSSPRLSPTVADVFTPIALPGVNVPNLGYMYAVCFFSPGVTFSEASYNQ